MNPQQVQESLRQLQQFSENSDVNVQNYHKLMKMKKLLADTQKKMFNRIKLFQKASEKVLKKKQHEMKVFQKLQSIKKDPIFSRAITRPRTRQQAQRDHPRANQLKNTRSHEHIFVSGNQKLFVRSKQNILDPLTTNYRGSETQEAESNRKIFAEKINEERMRNAKIIKEDRQRNKIIIEQRKRKQLTRKLQSANIIRRQRQKAKMIKQQVLKQKQEDFKKFMEQKYERQKQEFVKLQIHLQQLQQKEKQALITWKKTIQS